MSTVTAIVCIAAQALSCQQMPVRVIDGDTIKIMSENVRFLGIDAPEMKGACAAESATARKAKARVATLISGAEVVVDRQGKDRHRRTLAIVKVRGADIGEILMAEGLARKWEKKWRPGMDDVWCRP